jgi:hypothetical protein
MATEQPASPFHGLDKALLRSTKQTVENTDTSTEEDAQTSIEVQKSTRTPVRKSRSKEAEKPVSVLPEPVAPEPLQKVGYYFTQDEIDLVDELHHELRRRHRIKISKSDIIRIALAHLNQNYQDKSEASFLIKEGRKKSSTKEV